MSKQSKSYNPIKAAQAAARKAHFANGGTLATWLGRASRTDESTSKARANKRACRGRWED